MCINNVYFKVSKTAFTCQKFQNGGSPAEKMNISYIKAAAEEGAHFKPSYESLGTKNWANKPRNALLFINGQKATTLSSQPHEW